RRRLLERRHAERAQTLGEIAWRGRRSDLPARTHAPLRTQERADLVDLSSDVVVTEAKMLHDGERGVLDDRAQPDDRVVAHDALVVRTERHEGVPALGEPEHGVG